VGSRYGGALNPLRRERDPGSTARRGSEETAGPHRGVTARARGIASPFAPPADGRREPATAPSSTGEGTSREESVPRLRGRKTLASLLGPLPRERQPRGSEEPTANERCHDRARARVVDGNGRIHRQRRSHRDLVLPSSGPSSRARRATGRALDLLSASVGRLSAALRRIRAISAGFSAKGRRPG
jgi:hypothetical protein